jgi:crotonobetainyl-CoA:carnitine CoA-transferase CaiB-like acyl-CoA transferase
MFEWLGHPREFADPAYGKLATRFASTTLIPAIARLFAGRTRTDLEEEGQRYGVPIAAVLDIDEALHTAQVEARGAFTQQALAPDVSAPFPNGTVEFDGRRAGVRGPAPALDHVESARWLDPRRRGSYPPGDPADRPLSGLRVLDLGVIVVGAEQGRLLSDQGAEVIKIEDDTHPDGSRQTRDGSVISVTFAAGHRNKLSMGLDLRSARGKELFLRLVAESDVVLTNFRPGTLEALGLGYDTLATVNPGIVLVDSSAFGPTGPWSRRLGYGPLVRASAGLTAQWRYPGESDGFSDAITVYPDHVAARVGAAAVLALLIRRARTGVGGTISISQAEVMLSHMASMAAEKGLLRGGVEVTGPVGPDAPWGVFPTAGEDDWCVVTVRDDTDWRALCRAIDRDDLGSDPALRSFEGRSAARARIDSGLAEWLSGLDVTTAMTRLQDVGVPAAAMLRVAELPFFEHYVERGVFRTETHPRIKQSFHLENAPVRSARLIDPPASAAPLLGEHTMRIARRLGLTDAEIAALVDEHVLQPLETTAEAGATV